MIYYSFVILSKFIVPKKYSNALKFENYFSVKNKLFPFNFYCYCSNYFNSYYIIYIYYYF